MNTKKILGFLRSMRFGMILLAAICALSVVGTVVQQGADPAYYTMRYGDALGGAILFLGADHIYSCWYYVGLYAQLCVNLAMCSILRTGHVRRLAASMENRLGKEPPAIRMDEESAVKLLKKEGFREKNGVYSKNRLGLYGSFVVHVGILLLFIASACVFSLQDNQDYAILIGDTVALEDGTSLRVDGFSLQDESGTLDYISELTVTRPDGSSRAETLRVNHPVSAGRYTFYQQNYGYCGVLGVRTEADAQDELVTLDDSAFISLDGVNGITYMAVYPDSVTDENGQVEPLSRASGGDAHPVYLINIIDGGESRMGMAMPDETLVVGGVYYTFRAPQPYPGIRVKTQPAWVLPLLYASFALLLAGLYLCFFHMPVFAAVRDGIVLTGTKDVSDWIERLEDQAR